MRKTYREDLVGDVMGLLYKKINNNYVELKNILKSGYSVNDQPNIISKQQYANGKRKKILTFYNDCIIKVKFDMFNISTYLEYKDYLVDGVFKYYSNDGTYKEAEFIVTNPALEIDLALASDTYIKPFEITLEKSGDVSD